jgi:hypothetical protein
MESDDVTKCVKYEGPQNDEPHCSCGCTLVPIEVTVDGETKMLWGCPRCDCEGDEWPDK